MNIFDTGCKKCFGFVFFFCGGVSFMEGNSTFLLIVDQSASMWIQKSILLNECKQILLIMIKKKKKKKKKPPKNKLIFINVSHI